MTFVRIVRRQRRSSRRKDGRGELITGDKRVAFCSYRL
jgi:hypothetical protein